MRYLAFCCDYDGTLAHHGRVDAATIDALERLAASGRRLILVTGRQVDDLARVFDRLDLFAVIVAENGGLLHWPASRAEEPLAEPPPERFVAALRAAGVAPLSTGRVIVATWQPHEQTALETIRDQRLELQVIFNKGAVMVVPAGINKAVGLARALGRLGLSPHNAVGVGDAENDHAFLRACECAVAVSNALPAIQERADIVTAGDHGTGVREIIEELLADDLASRDAALHRHHLPLGVDERGEEIRFSPYGPTLLLAGTSGGGKSTMAVGIIERLLAAGYTTCVLDPEGDYEGLGPLPSLGSTAGAPTIDEVVGLLEKPDQSCVVNLLAVPMDDRPAFAETLLSRVEELRRRIGRPHWLVVDEAHHVLPSSRTAGPGATSAALRSALLVTVHPARVGRRWLLGVAPMIAVGEDPNGTIRELAEAVGAPPPPPGSAPLDSGEALVWWRDPGSAPVRIQSVVSRLERRRHARKYAEGALGPDRSFYFRGPEGRLNLRAQNFAIFMQLLDGVDDETVLHHLRAHDYSRWIETGIKDPGLAERVRAIEGANGTADESRRRIRAAIEESYTLSA